MIVGGVRVKLMIGRGSWMVMRDKLTTKSTSSTFCFLDLRGLRREERDEFSLDDVLRVEAG